MIEGALRKLRSMTIDPFDRFWVVNAVAVWRNPNNRTCIKLISRFVRCFAQGITDRSPTVSLVQVNVNLFKMAFMELLELP